MPDLESSAAVFFQRAPWCWEELLAPFGENAFAPPLIDFDTLIDNHIGHRADDQSERKATYEHRLEHWPERIHRFFQKSVLKLLMDMRRICLRRASMQDPLTDFERECPDKREGDRVPDRSAERGCNQIAAKQPGQAECCQEVEPDQRCA